MLCARAGTRFNEEFGGLIKMLNVRQLRRLLLAAACSMCSMAAFAQAPIRITFSHFLGPASFFQTDLVEPWARELEARSGGKVKVEVFNSSSRFGDARKQATQVSDGAVDIALGLRGAEGERFWRTSIIELPFVVPNADSGSKALWNLYKSGGLANEWDGYKVLALFVQNPGLVHTRHTRVVNLSDLKGLRLRAPNRTVSVALESVGAIPMVMLPDELVPAMQAGRLDGIITNWGTPLPGFLDYMKQHTAVPFYASAFFIVMNKQRYESLPPDVKRAIEEVSGDALVAKFGGLWDRWDKPFLDGAHASDQEIVRLTPAQLRNWQEGLQPVSDRYIADLTQRGFTNARAVHADLVNALNPKK